MDKSENKQLEKVALINKSADEKRLATFVVLEPQDPDGMTTDAHADWYDSQAVEDACRNFVRFCNKANIMHSFETDAFEFVENYITLADMQINGQYIKKGTWLATIYAKEDWVWEGIKNGTFNGLSIQALGRVEKL